MRPARSRLECFALAVFLCFLALSTLSSVFPAMVVADPGREDVVAQRFDEQLEVSFDESLAVRKVFLVVGQRDVGIILMERSFVAAANGPLS